MNQLTTRTTAVFTAAMIAMIILAFAAVMTVSAQTEPERPTDLTATAVDQDTVSLTWNHPDPASVDHYLILSRTVSAGTGLIQVGTSTTTSFEHDGLEPESTYFYRVRPVNSQGEEGQRSARAEATTPAEETPAQEPDPTPVPDPTPAQPQPSDDKDQGNIARSSHNVLVSNTGQTSGGSAETGNHAGSQKRHAQKFTTGSNPAGYTVDEVRIYVGTAGDNAVPVITINSGGGTNPGTVLQTMTNPATFASGVITTFIAPAGTTLDADTSYFIVMVNSNTANNAIDRYQVGQTSANGEDNSGLSDWDIDDAGRIGTPGWGTTAVGVGYRIQIRGTANESSDATLSNLVLQDASDDSVLTLNPTFDTATLEYSTVVAYGMIEATIIPTLNDSNPSYEIQDGDGTALTDADTAKDGFQVSIARGLSTIKVVVTAEDDTTIQTYTVKVNRPQILVSTTGQSTDGSLLVGENVSGQQKLAQRFTTGGETEGYTLTEVRISISSTGTTSEPVFTIANTDNADDSNPGETLYTLTNQATFASGINIFNAPPNATLDASTKYFLVMDNTDTNTSGTFNVGATDSNAEDGSGLTDWNVTNSGRTKITTWANTASDWVFKLQARGIVGVDAAAAALPELSFDNINITVDEDGSQAALSVELSQTSADTVTVDYATSDITAEAGDDYTDTSGTLTFAPGETVKAIIVPILDDAIYETLERFNVTLSNPTGATLPAFPGAQINIAVDESPPTATIADVSAGEGADTMTVTLNLSHESSRRTVYETTTSRVGGTATQGADYENFLSGGEARITVPAGDTQASLDITITDDAAAETSETITIRWDNDPTGISNGDATPNTINFTGTITDNDSGVQLTIQDASADETSSSIAFRIDSSETLTQDVTFKYSTSIGASDSAEADDFDPESAVSHTLSAGSAAGFIDIDLNDDDLYEGDETFTVTISNPVNAGIADATATGTIIDDETQPTLEVLPASATEGDDIIFLVDLIGPLTEEDVTFNYATSRQSDDTSEATDFTRKIGTGTIAAGNSAALITVLTYDDGTNHTNSLYEGDETFTFTIFNPTVAAILHATAKGTILDDEDVPTASFQTISQQASENSGTVNNFIQFDIAPLTEGSAQISLTITGTATAGQDYETPDTMLTLSPRQSQFSEPITINDDNVYEISETVIVTLVAESDNIQIDPITGTKTLYISDNDDPPALSFASINKSVAENAGEAILTVNKNGLTEVIATVEYFTHELHIVNPDERYVTTSGTLTFQPDETSKTISVEIIDDNTYHNTPDQFRVHLNNPSHANLPSDPYFAARNIISDDPVPMASMADVTANERAGTMTVTLRLSHPSTQDISYRTPDNWEFRGGTATFEVDYEIQYDGSNPVIITVPAGQLTKSFDITLIDDDLEEPDETVELDWVKASSSQATPDQLTFTGTITDPPICDALGNLENAMIVKNLTGEITQPGQSKFHRIKLDPYRSYMIEAIGHNGQDMLGVEEHPNLTLFNPDIPAIWNAKATSRWITYGDRNDGTQPQNVIRRFLDSDYRTYKVEVNSGNNDTGTYQLKIRVNNICRLDENDNAHYQWAGGPLGYPAGSDLPAGTGGRQVLLTGTDWGNNNITRPEMHHVLGDNWDSNRDEDWIGVDLEDGELYTVRLRTKNSLPERLQATGLKILGIRDENGNEISGTASAGAAGKKVFVTDWTAPSTGRFHIAVGSEGNDRTGTYWLSIIKDATN